MPSDMAIGAIVGCIGTRRLAAGAALVVHEGPVEGLIRLAAEDIDRAQISLREKLASRTEES